MGAPGRWRAALDAVFGALAALQTSPLPLWKEAADECARLADLQWRFPPRGDSAAELANELRTFGDGVCIGLLLEQQGLFRCALKI